MDQLQPFNKNGSIDPQETILLFGGAALMLLGAGMVLSSESVRKYVGGLNPAGLLQAALPDLQRYLKLKEM